MRTHRRGLAMVGVGLLSSPCLAFAPGSYQLRAGQAVPSTAIRKPQQQSWPSNRHSSRRSTSPQQQQQQQQLSRRARRRVGDSSDATGATVGLAAEADGGGGEGGDGAVGAAKRDLTQDEKVDEINKLIYVTETLSSSKMMTIDSFGPEQSASARRGKKGRANNAAPSYAAQEPMLPQAITRKQRASEKRKAEASNQQ